MTTTRPTWSATTTSVGCPEDLLVVLGRGALAPEEARVLAAHIATCPLCRMSARIAAATEPLPGLAVENDLLVARLVTGALGMATAETTVAKTASAKPSRNGERGVRRRDARGLPRWVVAAAGPAHRRHGRRDLMAIRLAGPRLAVGPTDQPAARSTRRAGKSAPPHPA
jgi:hypothetical protein